LTSEVGPLPDVVVGERLDAALVVAGVPREVRGYLTAPPPVVYRLFEEPTVALLDFETGDGGPVVVVLGHGWLL
jgi:hypothetical protein